MKKNFDIEHYKKGILTCADRKHKLYDLLYEVQDIPIYAESTEQRSNDGFLDNCKTCEILF